MKRGRSTEQPLLRKGSVVVSSPARMDDALMLLEILMPFTVMEPLSYWGS